MRWTRVANRGGGYPFALSAVAVAALALLPFRPALLAETFMLACVLVIILVARVCGLRPSTVSAIFAFLVLDFLFVPPYYRFTVSKNSELFALFAFLVVALVAGRQTARVLERERAALQRQGELELLHSVSLRLAAQTSRTATAQFIVEQVVEVLSASRAAFYVRDQPAQAPTCLVTAGPERPSPSESAFVNWVLKSGAGVWLGEECKQVDGARFVGAAEAIPGVVADAVFFPLGGPEDTDGVLVVYFGGWNPGTDETRVLAAVANLAAASLARQRLSHEAAQAEALAEADRLKTTLISSVSHELKTPLAAATMRVTGLLEEAPGCSGERVREELAEVAEDLARLNVSIVDLLDLSRLESDDWAPHFEAQDVSDVLGTVLSRLPAVTRTRVRFELSPTLPLVRADFSQLVRALANVVENALAYSPPDSEVLVGAGRLANAVSVWVEDGGPGIADAEKALVFDKFFRGEAAGASPSGTGLGLTIAQEIVRNHGGRVEIADVDPIGARVTFILPSAEGVS